MVAPGRGSPLSSVTVPDTVMSATLVTSSPLSKNTDKPSACEVKTMLKLAMRNEQLYSSHFGKLNGVLGNLFFIFLRFIVLIDLKNGMNTDSHPFQRWLPSILEVFFFSRTVF
jgi:hypothetical protein